MISQWRRHLYSSDGPQECTPDEPLQDDPAAGGEHQSLQCSANWDSRDVRHVSEVQHMPGGHLLPGRGGQADHHHRDVQPRHQAAGPEQDKNW